MLLLTFVASLPGQAAAEDGAAIVRSHCHDCHSSDLSEGEFSIEPLLKEELNAVSQAQTLEKIRKRVAAGEMPPQDAAPLEDAERTQLLHWLNGSLAQLAEELRDDPGLVVTPRLTPAEYRNVIRDLSGGVVSGGGRFLPNEGGAGEGFSNVGEAQG